MSGSRTYQLVYLGKWEAVLWTRFVEVRVVYTDSSLPGRLFHQDYVGQPLRLGHFPDKTCHEQLLNLHVDGLVSLWVEGPPLLDHRLMSRVDAQLVAHHCRVDSGHVLM